MKKAVFILIGITYLASIYLVNLLGLKSVVFVPQIPVTAVECINGTELDYSKIGKVTINNEGLKVITVDFRGPGKAEDMSGTMIQLHWRVLPDNATDKEVRLVYDESDRRVEFIKDGVIKDGEDNDGEGKEKVGRDLGMVLFKEAGTMIKVKITSTSSKNLFEEVWLVAK